MARQAKYIKPGEKVRAQLPFSEVCCHMKVAGTWMDVELLQDSHGYYSAQLHTLEGREFSFPITIGEAGLYQDSEGVYYYPDLGAPGSPSA